PLKTYLCEPFPWQIPAPPAILRDDNVTWEAKEQYFLKGFQTRFKSSMMTENIAVYVNESTTMIRDVMLWPQNFTDCQSDLVPQIISGQCYLPNVFGVNIGIACVWTSLEIESNSTLAPQVATIVYAIRMSFAPAYLTFKFCYRVALLLYILSQMWFKYYKYYLPLARQCSKITKAPRCYIIVGDPTSIFILNPVVCICLVVDMWLSSDVLAVQVVVVDKFINLIQFLLGCFYLSRTVWYCYSCLSLITYLLKRWHWETRFTAVDPTLVAIAAAVVAGPFTYFLAHSAFSKPLIWLFGIIAPSDHDMDASIGVILYISTIGFLPIFYGFGVRKKKKRVLKTKTFYHSFKYNDLKNRLLLGIETFFLGFSQVTRGSIHQILAQYPTLKRSPCISQRGADCYVVLYDSMNQVVDVLRLTLLDCIDLSSPPPNLNVINRNGDSIFGKIEITTSPDGMKLCTLSSSMNSSCPWIE
ncbi:hypothetical protein THRCLA_01323, partial [Thraustotheca clavata]